MAKENGNTMYQVSTLQALLLGYSRGVVTAEELVRRGSIGLGTFEDVNGESIILDGRVYRADDSGRAEPVAPDTGIPFASVADVHEDTAFTVADIDSIERLQQVLNNAIEEDFGLNSMYVVRLDGRFSRVMARSERGKHAQHVTFSEILEENRKDFTFRDITGTMVCVYYPDYMDGINAPGWHLHFISDDRQYGGHVFDLAFTSVSARRARLCDITIRLPSDPAFDTYSLRTVSEEEVKKTEQSPG